MHVCNIIKPRSSFLHNPPSIKNTPYLVSIIFTLKPYKWIKKCQILMRHFVKSFILWRHVNLSASDPSQSSKRSLHTIIKYNHICFSKKYFNPLAHWSAMCNNFQSELEQYLVGTYCWNIKQCKTINYVWNFQETALGFSPLIHS